MKLANECRSLEDVRAEIDRLDHEIIAAMGERLDYVKAASAFKANEASIPAPERVAAQLPVRRAWALKAGIDPQFTERIFREIIAWFINEQVLYYRAKAGAQPLPGQVIDRARLLDALRVGLERAKSRSRPTLVSVTQRIDRLDPIAAFDSARKSARQAFLWAPSLGFAIVGVDAAQMISGQGGERFAQALAAWRDLLDGAVVENAEGAPGAGPVLSGGFAFDPKQVKTPLWNDFTDAGLVLPRLQLTNSLEASYLTLNVVIEAHREPTMEADRLEQLWQQVLGQYDADLKAESNGGSLRYQDVLPPEQWKQLVAEAVATIRTGSMQKVVLAREVRVTNTQPFEIGQSLALLRVIRPDAYLFAVARAGRCFFGASPERLVRLNSRKVEVTALAGTSRCGASQTEDELLAERLLASPKDRHEHALVVEALRSTLAAFCTDLDIPAEPTLYKLKDVQHLYTPVVGRLRADATLLDLVAALHPTPAVGGLPQDEALAYLREHEQLDRGWFAGPVGWIDGQGDGEFAVALRSGLASANEASLFAGCGIVGDSDPDSEFAETRLKLRTMLFALGLEERQIPRARRKSDRVSASAPAGS